MRSLSPRPALFVLALLLIVGAIVLLEFGFDRADPGGDRVQATLAEPPPAPEPPAEAPAEPRVAVEKTAPEDKTLTLTIPKMGRIEKDTIPYTTGDDEPALKANAGIHLKGTGFPWEDEANVYIAGHRLGFPGTDSFLAFYDQQKLQNGDEIYVTDSEGNRYTYRVFEEFVVQPEDVYVTEPVEGKNILTLQTCTLPNYTERLVTRAELVDA